VAIFRNANMKAGKVNDRIFNAASKGLYIMRIKGIYRDGRNISNPFYSSSNTTTYTKYSKKSTKKGGRFLSSIILSMIGIQFFFCFVCFF
jgi:hypothetical protein